MIFYKKDSSSPPRDAVFPCAVLVKDDWNDFGYYTLWKVTIYRSRRENIMTSAVKILQLDSENEGRAKYLTKISSGFSTLSDEYCSLGQDMKYYELLFAAGQEIYENYLNGLRDVAINPKFAIGFSETEGFLKSLLRFSDAEKAFREAKTFFDNVIIQRSLKFTFRSKVPGAIAPHEVTFDFSHHPTGLNRVWVIIGRNGTGKTQFLAQFAGAMSGWQMNQEFFYEFIPQRPGFSKVIAVSYSVFDDFPRPSENSRTFSYKYCGIRAPDTAHRGVNEGTVPIPDRQAGARFLSPAQLKRQLIKARDDIRSQEREEGWRGIIEILLEGTVELTTESFEDLTFYDRLSSGQRILVAVMTGIIANISKQTVILFDEPELHLHPEVLAALARALDQLLNEFDSYAIIATHSALLLQETLSRQVCIFRRKGATPRADPLMVESFGENLTSITSEVFSVNGEHYNFRTHLKELSEGRSPDEVESLFPLGLPLQAQAFLRAINAEGIQ